MCPVIPIVILGPGRFEALSIMFRCLLALNCLFFTVRIGKSTLANQIEYWLLRLLSSDIQQLSADPKNDHDWLLSAEGKTLAEESNSKADWLLKRPEFLTAPGFSAVTKGFFPSICLLLRINPFHSVTYPEFL